MLKKLLIIVTALICCLNLTSCIKDKKDNKEETINVNSVEYMLAQGLIDNFPKMYNPIATKVIDATYIYNKNIIQFRYMYQHSIDKIITVEYNYIPKSFKVTESDYQKYFTNLLQSNNNNSSNDYDYYYNYLYVSYTDNYYNKTYSSRFEKEKGYVFADIIVNPGIHYKNESIDYDEQYVYDFVLQHADRDNSIDVYKINKILHDYKESQGWLL